MTTELYSAHLVRAFRVKDNYYRAVESPSEYNKHTLLDIKNGGEIFEDVSMKQIMDFIGKDYEIITVLMTYETEESWLARYILPLKENNWKNIWKKDLKWELEFLEEDMDMEPENEQVMKELNNINAKIDEIFNEFKHVGNAIFNENLAHNEYAIIVAKLSDYKYEKNYDFVTKKINDREQFIITTSDYDNGDDVEYEIDKGYGEYFKVTYIYTGKYIDFELNLNQRHHYFSCDFN